MVAYFTTGLSPVGNLVVGLVHVFVRTHILVTGGRNCLILGMMMSYDLGLMPVTVVSQF